MTDGPKEITPSGIKINVLAAKSTQMEITSKQGVLALGIEKAGDFGDVGMGVLSNGTPYLNQRGLAVLCGVENAHIGTISSQWNEAELKPRIKKIKAILDESNLVAESAHVEIVHGGKTHFAIRRKSASRSSNTMQWTQVRTSKSRRAAIFACWPARS